MPEEAWNTTNERRRAHPMEEKARRCWASIPRAAVSLTAAGEPVSRAVLKAKHAREALLSAISKPTGSD